jgi:eukaryotic-like serine/threonine-protein kinase
MATPINKSANKIISKIGKYQVLAELGRGENSVVYRAFDDFAHRDLAIKVFNQHLVEPSTSFDMDFLATISTSSTISHPHIVRTYDAVREDGLSYIVMELVQGASLQAHTEVGKLLPIQRLIQLMFKCCMALDFASFQGVIHQDIKPSNIMYTQDGEVKIADFGTAAIVASDSAEMTHFPNYAAPEVYAGDQPSAQSDIYSLGVVLYRLLTGQLPYKGDDAFSYFDEVMHQAPINIRSLRPEVPDSLAALVHKAIQKDPAKRYGAWVDMASELASCEMLVENETKIINDSEKFSALKRIDFFTEFSDVEIWEVIRISEWAKFLSGRTLVKEGDFGASFFMLIKGRVEVAKNGKVLTHLDKGDCFGEMAYIDKTKPERSASVVSTMPVMLMKIKSEALEQASEHLQLRFNRAFLKVLVQRLAQANAALAANK